MAYLPKCFAVSHAFKVKALYKEALRQTQSYYPERHVFRYHATLLRVRFDEHKDEVDMMKAKKLLKAGEAELFAKHHPQRLTFCESPGGSAYDREVFIPDWMLDMWHPLERAQYPEYFKRRDQRKQEYIEKWEKTYGNSAAADH